MSLLFGAHVFACWFMTGAIWLVQILVYPLFNSIGRDEFQSLHQFHMRRITWIVAPVMALELATAIGLFALNHSSLLLMVNLASVAALWLLTAFVNVPSHNRLSFACAHSKQNLVRRNWPRTGIWTGRAVFLLWMILPFSPEVIA